jgi:hypothetical protein
MPGWFTELAHGAGFTPDTRAGRYSRYNYIEGTGFKICYRLIIDKISNVI